MVKKFADSVAVRLIDESTVQIGSTPHKAVVLTQLSTMQINYILNLANVLKTEMSFDENNTEIVAITKKLTALKLFDNKNNSLVPYIIGYARFDKVALEISKHLLQNGLQTIICDANNYQEQTNIDLLKKYADQNSLICNIESSFDLKPDLIVANFYHQYALNVCDEAYKKGISLFPVLYRSDDVVIGPIIEAPHTICLNCVANQIDPKVHKHSISEPNNTKYSYVYNQFNILNHRWQTNIAIVAAQITAKLLNSDFKLNTANLCQLIKDFTDIEYMTLEVDASCDCQYFLNQLHDDNGFDD